MDIGAIPPAWTSAGEEQLSKQLTERLVTDPTAAAGQEQLLKQLSEGMVVDAMMQDAGDIEKSGAQLKSDIDKLNKRMKEALQEEES